MEEIYQAIKKAKRTKGKPSALVLDTIKGQGVKFVEDTMANHHMRFTEKEHQLAKEAIREL